MKNLDRRTKILLVVSLLVGLLLGALFFGGSSKTEETTVKSTTETKKAEVWTCSMHPQIRQSGPGHCPICGMDLIPLESSDNLVDPDAITMSPSAMILAGISTYRVGFSDGIKDIPLNGKIEVNDKKVYSQSSHIPGRIEKIQVTYEGEYVQKGQLVANVYSPELSSAQQELLEAYSVKDMQPQLYQSVRTKLKNWKISDASINAIISSRKIRESFPIFADVSGYVVKKNVELGDYVQRGQTLFDVADLSSVWVLFEIYESDMNWIKKGDVVNYTVASLPGEKFSGRISFIDPFINPTTRVANARVEISNPGLKFKPAMFVSGNVEAKIASNKAIISVPKTAVMWTGKRSVVYVQTNTDKGSSFKLREVTLGPQLGDDYIIQDGLSAGEEVVENGTFNVDAAAQLAGKPSMMNQKEEVKGHTIDTDKVVLKNDKVADNAEINKNLQPLYRNYFALTDALTKDDFTKAKVALLKFDKEIAQVDSQVFSAESLKVWSNFKSKLNAETKYAVKLKDIEKLRTKFEAIANVMIDVTKAFTPLDESTYVQFCPMAHNNKGAIWLSDKKEIVNPYLGKKMLTCGSTKQVLK